MDTLTHALLGAAAAQVCRPRRGAALGTRQRLLLGAAAGAFPDLDFVGFLWHPLRFLADGHQGPTHSLLLLPLWALAIAALAAALLAPPHRRREVFAEAYLAVVAVLVVHLAADVITAYGVMLAFPLSTQRWALGWINAVDPVFSALALLALLAAWRSARRAPALLVAGVLAGYVGVQGLAQQRAVEVARGWAQAQGLAVQRISAFAQPLSPWHWRLIASERDLHHVADLDLAPPGLAAWTPALPWPQPLREMLAAYRPPAALQWQAHLRADGSLRPPLELPAGRVRLDAAQAADAQAAWRAAPLAPLRRFATHPALYRVDTAADGRLRCAWFTDLRYDLPQLPATFRYGLCRDDPAQPWRLYRLRYLQADARVALPP
jgi:inner membrane protein